VTAKQIIKSLRGVFNNAWKRHVDILGLMVAAAFDARVLGIASLGRHLRSLTSPKHSIKRVNRFLGNKHFDDQQAQEDLLRTVIGPRKRVFIAVDWTKVRQWPVLVAGVVRRGRAVPVMWQVMGEHVMYKSQNHFEHGFFTWLAQSMPDGVQAIVLLDRGFQRVDLVTRLRRCGLSFVIRTGGNVKVTHRKYTGPMQKLITRRGQQRDLADAVLKPSRPVEVRVVGLWERGQKESWLLMTNLDDSVKDVAKFYGWRFRIEETFRDEKNHRFGLALGDLKLRSAQRMERMLLVAALAHFFALLVGSESRRRGYDRQFQANTVRNKPTHSDFTLGVYYLLRLRLKFAELLREFWTEPCEEFWG